MRRKKRRRRRRREGRRKGHVRWTLRKVKRMCWRKSVRIQMMAQVLRQKGLSWMMQMACPFPLGLQL
jgi:hypothetical protein